MRSIFILCICLALAASPAFAKKDDKIKKQKKMPPGLEKKYQRTGSKCFRCHIGISCKENLIMRDL